MDRTRSLSDDISAWPARKPKTVKKQRAKGQKTSSVKAILVNPKLIYLCDPVMGDNGEMYVPESVLPVYKEKVLPLADIITPNQFEAELLTGVTIRSEQDALKATQYFHARGVPTVVISSTELGAEGKLLALGSHMNKDGSQAGVRIEIPRQPHTFVGTGDLFAALLLAHMTRSHDLQVACEKTMSTMHAVLERTTAAARALCRPGQSPGAAQLELRLVQSKRDIEQAEITLHAQKLAL